MKLISLLAYIDPMSGSLLLQALIAGGITCAAFFRRWIGRVLSVVARPVRRLFGNEEKVSAHAKPGACSPCETEASYKKAA